MINNLVGVGDSCKNIKIVLQYVCGNEVLVNGAISIHRN